jgi:hypothetical protein
VDLEFRYLAVAYFCFATAGGVPPPDCVAWHDICVTRDCVAPIRHIWLVAFPILIVLGFKQKNKKNNISLCSNLWK